MRAESRADDEWRPLAFKRDETMLVTRVQLPSAVGTTDEMFHQS